MVSALDITKELNANKGPGCKKLRMKGGREVKVAVCDVRKGLLFTVFTNESFSTLPFLPAQHLCVNKPYRDYLKLVSMIRE